jgi:HEAT repeats
VIQLFTWGSLVFAAAAVLFVAVLAIRRVQLARGERRRAAAETRLRPVALDLLAGEGGDIEPLGQEEVEVLAGLLGRYSRQLSGTATAQVAAFFERGGGLERELGTLRSRRAWRRATAAYALGDMGSDAAVPALVAALADPKREVRSAAARSLGRLGAVEAVEPLVYALVGTGIPRAVAGQALLAIGAAALPSLRSLEARAEAEVRAFAVELVGLLGDASDGPLLIERLRDSSAEVRAKAARALGRLGAEEAAAELRAALVDRIPFVRTAAAFALGMIDDREAVDALLEQARGEHFDLARSAAQAVARIDPERVSAAAQTAHAGTHVLEAADLLALGAR